jgi:hypothetical protein
MDWARDFASNFVLKIEGILDVFQDFYKQKNRPRHKKEFLEVPYKKTAQVFACAAEMHEKYPFVTK